MHHTFSVNNSLLIEEQRAGSRDSPTTRTANCVLTGHSVTRLKTKYPKRDRTREHSRGKTADWYKDCLAKFCKEIEQQFRTLTLYMLKKICCEFTVWIEFGELNIYTSLETFC